MIIRTRATASIDRPAELARLAATVSFDDPDAAASMSSTGNLAAQLRDALESIERAGGLSDLLVASPRTSSRIPYPDDGSNRPIFTTVIEFEATFADAEVLNGVTARWGGVAGISLADARWSLTAATLREAEDAALRDAVALARHRAEVIGDASGATRLELVEIGDPDRTTAPMPGAAMFSRSLDAGAGPATGQQVTVTAHIEAIFDAVGENAGQSA